jgi:AcrR family transcriptional regulator
VAVSRAQSGATRDALLAAAVKELDEQGQGAFRLARVLDVANASFSSLYHHFGSREGLLRDAHLERFRQSTRHDLASFASAALRAATTEAFLTLVASHVLDAANNPSVQRGRRQRIESLAVALTDPELLDLIIPIQQHHFSSLAAIFDRVRQRGLIRQDLNFESYVAWVNGMQLGHVLLEIDRELGPTSSTWNRCAVLATLQPLTIDHEPLVWSPAWESTPTTTGSPPTPLAYADIPTTSEHPTAKALLANTMAILDQSGEQAVRLPHVLEGTETSVTSIYHFFGDREGLITAANAERFMRVSPGVVVDFRTATSLAKTPEDFFAFLRLNLLSHVINDDIMKWRWSRIEVLGAAFRRPSLLTAVEQSQQRIIAQFASITQEAQRRAFLRPDIEPRSAALWFQGMQMGRVLTEIQPDLDHHHEWLDLSIEGIDAALRLPNELSAAPSGAGA